jgi:hypothetical protein
MFIKHNNMMDVCIEVRHISNTLDGIKIYGSFWNLGQDGKSFFIGAEVKIKIPFTDIDSWKQCSKSTENLRLAQWVDFKKNFESDGEL